MKPLANIFLMVLFFFTSCSEDNPEFNQQYDVKIKIKDLVEIVENARLANDLIDNGVQLVITNGDYTQYHDLESLNDELILYGLNGLEHTLRARAYVNEEMSRVFYKEIKFNPAVDKELLVSLEDECTRFTFRSKENSVWPEGFDQVEFNITAYNGFNIHPDTYELYFEPGSFQLPSFTIKKEEWESSGFVYCLPFEVETMNIKLTGPDKEVEHAFYFAEDVMTPGAWFEKGKSYTLATDLEVVAGEGANSGVFALNEVEYIEEERDVF